MANSSVFKVNNGGQDGMLTSSLAAAAASQTVPHSGRDSRLALRVTNGNPTGIVVSIAAGGGPRAALGNMNVAVEGSSTAYIALFDTARYKNLSTGVITVALNNAEGGALTTELASVQIEAVQM